MNPFVNNILRIAGFSLLLASSSNALAENPSFNADAGTFVNSLDRKYGEDHFDIPFHTPGFDIWLQRSYYQGRGWDVRFPMENLTLQRSPSNPAIIEAIVRNGTTFRESGDDWVNKEQTISLSETGYRFDDSVTDEWAEYDADGVLLSFGIKTFIRGEITTDSEGRVLAIEDSEQNIVGEIEYNAEGRIVAASNHAGASVAYTWQGDNLESFVDVRGNTTTYEYSGELISRKGLPGGIVRNIAYDSTYDSVRSITNADGVGRFFEYSYDNEFNEYYYREEWTSGKIVERRFNSSRELIRVSVNGTVVQEINYLDDGKRILITDGFGNLTEELISVNDTNRTVLLPNGEETKTVIQFDDKDGNYRLIREVDSRGFETRYTYDNLNRVTRMTEARGTTFERVTEYEYDGGNLASETLVGDFATPTATTHYHYDDYSRLIRTTYPEGNESRVEYDDFNRVVVRYDGYDEPSTFVYNDATGDLLEAINSLGEKQIYTYDFIGRDASITNALNQTTSFEHTLNQWRQIDPSGQTSVMNYDAYGNVISYVDASGKPTIREYDECGRVVALVDGNGNRTGIFYHDEGAPISPGDAGLVDRVEFPTFEQIFEYDELLRQSAETFAYGSVERRVEALGFIGAGDSLPAAIRDPSGVVTHYSYDPFGNVISESKSVGDEDRVVNYEYDDFGRVVSVELPEGGFYRYSYDRNGNQVEQRLPQGETYELSYDLNDRLVQIDYPSGARKIDSWNGANQRVEEAWFLPENESDVPDSVKTYSYDAAGRVQQISQDGVTLTLTRDAVGRIIGESINHGDGVTLSHSQDFYANGQLKEFTGPDGITYSYTYDNAGLLATIDIPGRGAVTYSDYKWMMPQTVVYPGGATRSTEYNGFMEVMGIDVRDGDGDLLFGEDYSRNALQFVDSIYSDSETATIEFDEHRQVTDIASSIPSIPSETFEYDLNENRTSDSDGRSYTYDGSNRLLAVGADSFTYSDDGLMISQERNGEIHSYNYDPAGRLIGVSIDGSPVASYRYDPLGRRISKTVAGVTTRFHYSVLGLVAEADASGNVIRSYGYEVSGYREDQLYSTPGLRPLFMKVGGDYQFFVYDFNFRQRMLFRPDGEVVWSATVGAFGETEVDSGASVTCNLRLSNQYFDSESGLHYNINRYYDPYIGRYLQVDPLGLSAGLNFYAFVSNNPIAATDALGLACSGCLPLAYSDNTDRDLFPIGPAKVQLKMKASFKGQICRKCCDDGTCGWKGSFGGELQAEIAATVKSNQFDIGICKGGLGIKVFAAGGGAVGGSASVDCDNPCGEFKGKLYGKIGIGGYAEAQCLGVGFEIFGGGAAQVCGLLKVKVCGDGTVSASVGDIEYGGEIYLEFKYINGKKIGKNKLSNAFKITILKAGGC